jgi:protein involved in polysaccharide export with SLBB domain
VRLLKGIILACCLSAPLLAQNESLLIGPGDEVNVEVFDTPRSRRQRLLARSKRLLSGRV